MSCSVANTFIEMTEEMLKQIYNMFTIRYDLTAGTWKAGKEVEAREASEWEWDIQGCLVHKKLLWFKWFEIKLGGSNLSSKIIIEVRSKPRRQ